ncbi:tRNA pseudouridine(13) synthase TruD [Methylogaea oryzae]
MAERLGWEREGDTLWLEFFLPAGAYATTVVREILACE